MTISTSAERSHRLTLSALLLLLHGGVAGAAEVTATKIEWRSHYEASHATSGAAYRMTEITQLLAQTEDKMVTLVLDETTGDQLRVEHTIDYLRQEATIEISDLDSGETVRSRQSLPYKSLTRGGAAEELKKRRHELRQTDPLIAIAINGEEQSGHESAWMTAASRDRRSTIRRAASGQFLEKLERLRAVVTPDSPLHHACVSALRYILYKESCADPLAQVKSASPDCEFDASFRYACSQKQKERVAQAKERNEEVLERY